MNTRPNSRYGDSLRNTSLRRRYEEQITSPDLISLRDELGLVGGRLSELLDKLDGKGIDFLTLLEQYTLICTYVSIKDFDSTTRILDQMGVVLQQGVKESEIWKEAYHVIEQRRKLVDTEMKTISSIGAMLSTEQFMILLNKLVAAINLHADQQTVVAIHGEIEKILDLVPTLNTIAEPLER